MSSEPPDDRVPPGTTARARRTFTDEELLAEIREIERGGGRKLEEFIGELEELAGRRTSDSDGERGA